MEIQGFKSFAEKTVLEFPETSNHDIKAHSISGIVGPNGSGKSNIADAIRWILGEQSVKLLRGKKNEDVIFAGSEKRARLGFAEASLYFDNSDQKSGIEYTELVITRRIYRDGEGEYLINKNKVRLFDVLMLLAKANFGQKSYSIVGQGMVDHIINISPWERKEFFDEATGVKQYQIKRDQSVNRLTRSKENLEQTNGILTEMEPHLRLLTKQVKKLEKRQEIETQLREMQKKYYGHLWHRYDIEEKKHQDDLSIKQSIKQELDEALMQIQVKLAEMAKQESRKDIFNNLQKEFAKLQQEKNDLLKDLAELKGKMNLEYIKFGKQNLAWLENKKEDLGHRIAEVQDSLNNLVLKLDRKNLDLNDQQEKQKQQIDNIMILQNNLQSAENSLSLLKGGRFNYFHEAVRAILRQKDHIKGIYGTVADLAKTEKIYESALAVAAGSRLTAVVVKDEDVALKCIGFLKDNKLPPVTFLPLNKIKAYPIAENAKDILAKTGAIAFACDLLNYDPKFQKVYQHIFGATVVVDTALNAREIGINKERMVTLDGDIFEKTGVMKGGFRRTEEVRWVGVGNDSSNVTQEEKLREIAILKSKISDLLKQKDLIAEELNNLKVDIQFSQTKQKALQNDLDDLLREKNKVEQEISDSSILPQDQDAYMKELNIRRTDLEKSIEKLDEKISQIRQKIDAFNLDEERKKDEVFRLQREMQECQLKVNQAEQELNEIKIELAKLSAKKEDLLKEILQELGPDVEIDKLMNMEVINPDQLWFEIGKLKQSLDLIGGIDPEIIQEHQEVSERYEFLSTQTKDLEKAIIDLEKVIDELDSVISKQFNASFKKINESFKKYFVKIFQGGQAKLTLLQKEQNKKNEDESENINFVDGQNIPVAEELDSNEKQNKKIENIQTGIDIYVSPPNKKVNNISALSGGERTMTSLALLCAIIESNPAPFVVMDEVDAALDEANSERFAAILQELSYKTQFIVITHNRVLMHVADVLYGVAMGDDGVSKTLSLDLKEAEKQIK